MRLYLDGCSLVYGHGLPRDQSLYHLFKHNSKYAVTDQSRPAKSNITVAVDVHNAWQDHDIFVVGWTFADRFGIKYNDVNLDFYPGRNLKETKNTTDAFTENHKYFYTIFGPPFSSDLSNMLIDGLHAFLTSNNKTVVFFSWESRSVSCDIKYPYILPSQRLNDGHLDQNGTRYLYNLLQAWIDEQQRR